MKVAEQTSNISTRVGNGASKGRFGTFAGVLTPNILTILGLILFLRSGWVVGQAGLIGALSIVILSNVITFLTGLSLSAIATSMTVKTGGNYYLISRSLGLEIGGAIGIPLYLSQAISVAFYVIGFTEALTSISLFQASDPRLISTVVVLLFGLIAYLGADFALRIQFIVLAALGAALVSFFAGGWGDIIQPHFRASYTGSVGYWAVFAIFFPAVTGITVGASMSGDLKDPAKSIPQGTIWAIVITTIIYIVTIIWLALHASPEQLQTDTLIMTKIARWPILILVGVWAATLSSALGSVVAAPRTLQALSFDAVMPRWMASQLGSATEPRMAVLITMAIAISIVWMGDLDFVAPVISMFFLNTYGMTNLAAAIEKFVGNPSYRPRFNVSWIVSLLGAMGCYGAMFLINPLATVIAIIVSYGIYFYLDHQTVESSWGDVRRGISLTVARAALLALEAQRTHVKNWRPNILVFTGQPHNREHLTALADWLSMGQGIITFYQLIVGDPENPNTNRLRERARQHIRNFIAERHMKAFAEVDVVRNFHSGALTVAQTHGLGGLKSNTVLMGWSREPEGQVAQFQLLRDLLHVDKSTLLFEYNHERAFGNYKMIDIWWSGQSANGALMVLLAHVIKQHPKWQSAHIRLLRIVASEEGRLQTQEYMEKLLADVRVNAETVIIVEPDRSKFFGQTIARHSQETGLTVIGSKLDHVENLATYGQRMNELLEHIGTTLIVSAARDDDLLNIE